LTNATPAGRRAPLETPARPVRCIIRPWIPLVIPGLTNRVWRPRPRGQQAAPNSPTRRPNYQQTSRSANRSPAHSHDRRFAAVRTRKIALLNGPLAGFSGPNSRETQANSVKRRSRRLSPIVPICRQNGRCRVGRGIASHARGRWFETSRAHLKACNLPLSCRRHPARGLLLAAAIAAPGGPRQQSLAHPMCRFRCTRALSRR